MAVTSARVAVAGLQVIPQRSEIALAYSSAFVRQMVPATRNHLHVDGGKQKADLFEVEPPIDRIIRVTLYDQDLVMTDRTRKKAGQPTLQRRDPTNRHLQRLKRIPA